LYFNLRSHNLLLDRRLIRHSVHSRWHLSASRARSALTCGCRRLFSRRYCRNILGLVNWLPCHCIFPCCDAQYVIFKKFASVLLCSAT
jgi:hypothetical protein